MVLFLFGTFLGLELLGFRIDVCFTFLKNLLAFQSACVDLFFQMPGIITHWLMLCARRNKENEQSRLMSAAFLSMERFFKKTLSLWMPLDPHDSRLGESSREAQSGRRLLGTNGGSLWLWWCLAQPGALGPWVPPPSASSGRLSNRWGMQPWALSLPDKELCLREALAVCTPPAPEPSAKRPGS